ncbi:MAG: PAS domain S-box protein [Chloroflexi bacterium]|nr:PAS domain S-box protein [Chloroflexota bacterium]
MRPLSCDQLVLECDLQGRVTAVLRDDLGASGPGARKPPRLAGALFAACVEASSLHRALTFLSQVQTEGHAQGWRLGVPVGDQSLSLVFSGMCVGDGLVIIGTRNQESGEGDISGTLHPLNKHPDCSVQSSAADLGCFTVIDTLYNEISRMNNELINLQRDLTRKNVQLERLNLQIERHAEHLQEEISARTAELRRSEAHFRAVFENTGIGMALIDADGQVVENNAALARVLGHTIGDLRGHRIPLLLECDYGDASLDDLLQGARDSASGYWSVEARCARQDDEMIWVILTVASLQGADSSERLFVALVEDITEERQTREALMHADRLALASALAASLAHEISNPLQSVIGCLGLADEAMQQGRDASEYLQIARAELRRVTTLVGQMRRLQAQPSARMRAPTDVDRLLAQTLLLCQKRCEDAGVLVHYESRPMPPALLVDADQIRQVFLNLILNALEAMPNGGSLQIDVTPTNLPPGVRVSFSDSGLGIDPDELQHVFRPFHTTKSEGMGLGLFISRDILKDHGGTIEAESVQGHGATFTVWLPAMDRADVSIA